MVTKLKIPPFSTSKSQYSFVSVLDKKRENQAWVIRQTVPEFWSVNVGVREG
jgi:hypothetical protein